MSHNTMKKFLLLSFVLLTVTSVRAQRTADIGLSGGVVHYVGDLGNEKYFPMSSASTGTAITLRNFINNPKKSGTKMPSFDMQLRLSWHRLQYDETTPIAAKKGLQLRNYFRGINFRNDLLGTEVDFTYNIYPNRYAPLNKPHFNFFFSAGVGVFYGKPKADLFNGSAEAANRYFFWSDGTVRDVAQNDQGIGNEIERDGVYETDLQKWHTEGQGFVPEIHKSQPYGNWNVAFPMGAGVRYLYNKYLTFTAEFNYYYFLTDYLDDVSDRYATYEELKASFPDQENFELAKYISDPSGRGTNGILGPPVTSRRGNPDLKDAFTYVSIEASYKFVWKQKGIYGQ
jgi:hypothetical protein